MRIKILILFFISSAVWAQSGEVKSPHHTGLFSSLNLGIRYSSVFENRGVILYRDFQVDPVLGAFFLDDKLEFLGDSIGYRDFIYRDVLRLRGRLISISDKPLFPNYESVKFSTPEREDTTELSLQAELFLNGYGEKYFAEIDLDFHQDLAAHHGKYIELKSKIKLFDFSVFKSGPKIEPNFYSSLGWGDSQHNQYFYGPSAQNSEFNNFSYGVWFSFPEEADRFYPIILLKHFEVIGKSQDAEFARERNQGWLISFIATYGVL
jgi:hypothetical protein